MADESSLLVAAAGLAAGVGYFVLSGNGGWSNLPGLGSGTSGGNGNGNGDGNGDGNGSGSGGSESAFAGADLAYAAEQGFQNILGKLNEPQPTGEGAENVETITDESGSVVGASFDHEQDSPNVEERIVSAQETDRGVVHNPLSTTPIAADASDASAHAIQTGEPTLF